jgi:GNAT superfamily N-acetyltransferase
VAEGIAGSNGLDDRGGIAGVGPITIDPGAQNRGAGRKLMDAVLGRARERSALGVWLVYLSQPVSFALHHAGFRRRGTIVFVAGPSHQAHRGISRSSGASFGPGGVQRVFRQVPGTIAAES